MNRRTVTRTLLPLWLTIWLPFATLPWITIAQYQFHIVFHVLYILILVAASWLSGRFVARAPTRSQRIAGRVLVVSQVAGLVGHGLELATSLRTLVDDGYAATDSAYLLDEEPFHLWSANLTVPALVIGLVTLLVLTVLAYRQSGDTSV